MFMRLTTLIADDVKNDPREPEAVLGVGRNHRGHPGGGEVAIFGQALRPAALHSPLTFLLKISMTIPGTQSNILTSTE